ncbi:MAG: HEPN domain-containing protein [Nanoarchaeota archaeon]|nr:HEPN domain-containing protein [Nanoarchaeota archaeon]
MNEKEVQDAINYWIEIAKRDYDTMLALFGSGRYPESLFFGHIIIEKTIKGLVTKETREQPPYIHDLLRLAELAKLDLDNEKMDFLDMLNDFNIRARYPEHKLNLYKKCDKAFAEKNLEIIKELYNKLCLKLK